MKQRWLFQGDSVTDCDRNRLLDDDLGHGYVHWMAETLHRKQPDIIIMNRGVSGHRTHDLVLRWQQDTITLKPDRLFLLIGINNIWHQYLLNKPAYLYEYDHHLRWMLNETKRQLPNTKITLLSPFLLPIGVAQPQWFDELKMQIEVLKQMAIDYQIPWIPLHDLLNQSPHAKTMTTDGVHPTTLGHQTIAAIVLKSIGD
jgi:acyl-CoA thioesterase I